jgi:hypothetical protein
VTVEDIFSLRQEEPIHHLYVPKVGNRYGMIEVLFYAGRNSRKKNQYACRCDCGNVVLLPSNNLNSSVTACGCLRESNLIKIQKEKKIPVEDLIHIVESKTRFKVLNTYDGLTSSAWEFLCLEHGSFKTQASNVIYSNQGCRKCSETGFNTNKPAALYIHRIEMFGEVVGLKFGITNCEVKSRHRQLQRKTIADLNCLLEVHDQDGSLIYHIENEIKKKFKTGVISKDVLPDGFTETIEPKLETELLLWLSKEFPQIMNIG